MSERLCHDTLFIFNTTVLSQLKFSIHQIYEYAYVHDVPVSMTGMKTPPNGFDQSLLLH